MLLIQVAATTGLGSSTPGVGAIGGLDFSQCKAYNQLWVNRWSQTTNFQKWSMKCVPDAVARELPSHTLPVPPPKGMLSVLKGVGSSLQKKIVEKAQQTDLQGMKQNFTTQLKHGFEKVSH